MFIRYNQLAKYWEYDGSGGVGTGPWIKLEIDYSQIINAPAIPTIPPNIAYTNVQNKFTIQPQIISTGSPRLQLEDTTGAPDNRKFEMVAVSNEVWFHFINDTENIQTAVPLRLTRSGAISTGGAIYERNRTIPMGNWQDVPFNAANFVPSSASGLWIVSAGNVLVNRYTLIGKTMIWTVRIQGSTTQGTLNEYMHIYIPGGYTARDYSGATKATEMFDGSVASTRVFPLAGYLMTMQKEGGPYVTGTLYIAFTISFEID